jgi:hypothetical protein
MLRLGAESDAASVACTAEHPAAGEHGRTTRSVSLPQPEAARRLRDNARMFGTEVPIVQEIREFLATPATDLARVAASRQLTRPRAVSDLPLN